MVSILIGIVAAAVVGGLVEYLLGLLLPAERVPTKKHLASIVVALLTFALISVWVRDNEARSNSDETLNTLSTIQAREGTVAEAIATLQERNLSGTHNLLYTATALAQTLSNLKGTESALKRLESNMATPRTPHITFTPTPTIINPTSTPVPPTPVIELDPIIAQAVRGGAIMLEGPGLGFDLVRLLVHDSILGPVQFEILGKHPSLDYYNIRIRDGTLGWVAATSVELLTPANEQEIPVVATVPPPSPLILTAIAKSFTRTPGP